MNTTFQSQSLSTTAVRLLALTLATACAAFALVAPRAAAQTDDVAPYFVIVNADNALLRCAPATEWYAITEVSNGTLLRVDQKGSGWLRVAYPDGTPVIVAASNASYDQGARMVTLTRQSYLNAYNMTDGTLGGAYRRVVWDDERLRQPNLMMEATQVLRNRAGNHEAYKAVAPQGARGFILESQTRPAQRNELPQSVQPQPTPGPESVEADPAVPAEQTTPVVDEPAEKVDTPEETTAQTTEQAETNAPAEATPADGTATESAEGAVVDEVLLAQLNASFEQVIAQPDSHAEYAALVTEFRALRDTIEGDSPQAVLVRESIDERLDVLNVHSEIQAAKREIVELLQRARNMSERTVSVGESAPEYTAVGVLMTSAIYSGEGTMPLMYRVQASGDFGRTLAYVQGELVTRADGSVAGILDHHLGKVVGVRAAQTVPAEGQIEIVPVSRIDVIGPVQPAGEGAEDIPTEASE